MDQLLKKYAEETQKRKLDVFQGATGEDSPAVLSAQPRRIVIPKAASVPYSVSSSTASSLAISSHASTSADVRASSVVGEATQSSAPNQAIACPWTMPTGAMATIGRACGTDKISHHGYHRFYPRFIEHYRSLEGKSMLEVGVENSFSIKMWMEYFPLAYIFGLDINFTEEGERFKVFKADQSKYRELDVVRRQIESSDKPVFFVIDDGSHIPEHQILTFDLYFDMLLEPGGTYIIEDVETSYWTRNGLYGYTTHYGYRHTKSVIELFKCLVDDVNDEFLTNYNKRTQERDVKEVVSLNTRRAISTITFGMNCIIIVKKTDQERQYDNRRYRFASNL